VAGVVRGIFTVEGFRRHPPTGLRAHTSLSSEQRLSSGHGATSAFTWWTVSGYSM
jgi:hypothetical protein